MKIFIYVIGLFVAAWPLAVMPTAVQTQVLSPTTNNYTSARKNVLVLVSAYKADTWSEAITKGVEEVFSASADTIGIWTEYMDATRFTSSNATRVLARLYKRKYSGLKFEAIVTIGEPAVKFAQAHAKDLFAGAPIIFSGLDTEQAREAMRGGAITGVSEEFRYRKTLDAAFQLLPDTQKIIFISPDLKNRRIADLLLSDYRPEINVEIWHTPELAQILLRVAKIAPGAIILPLAEPGRLPQYSKSQDRFMDALTAASPVPVFSVWDVALGHGILGGYLTPGQYQGVLAGRHALELMHGKSLTASPVANVVANQLTVDRAVLQRFAIDTARLPDTVRFYPQESIHVRWLREYYQKIVLAFFFLSAISAILLYLLISRRKAQAALAESEARFRAVFEHLPMPLTMRDLNGRFLLVNPAFEKRHKFEPGTVDGQLAEQIFSHDFATVLREQDLDVIERNAAVEREHTLRDEPSGEDKTLLVVKFPVRDAHGSITAVGTCALDISERNRAMEALVKSELRFQSLYDNAPDIYFTLSSNGQISAVNKYGADYLGYDKATLEGRSIIDLIYTTDRDRVQENLSRLQQGAEQDQEPKYEFRFVRQDGTRLWVNMRVHVVAGAQGRDPSLWAICRDVSTAHQLSEELSYQASHDALTGLVNRRAFEQRLNRAVENIPKSKAQHALCFLDLDQFKIINDTCGHVAGDELLRQLGRVFVQRLRNRDIVARVGGDEFAVLMEHCPLQQACKIAEQIRTDVELHRFNWQGHIFCIGVSIGVAAIDVDSGSAEDILTAADSACYSAKDQGRNRIQVYTRDNLDVARHHGEPRWVNRLQQALAKDQFELWCQRIVPMSDHVDRPLRASFEILLRLRQEDNSLLLAERFMPSAERFGLAVKVDRWMLRHTFDWLSAHPDWLDSYASCFINLSATSITDEAFLKFVIDELARSAVPADCLCLVITETVAIANLTQTANFIAALKPRGCHFALGKFGSGLSSFTHLKRLDVDYLKIDGQLVRHVANDLVDLAMVQSIQHVGNIMNKMTIAESIENPQVFETLANLGVHFCQGDFQGPACILDELILSDIGTDLAPVRKAGRSEKGAA